MEEKKSGKLPVTYDNDINLHKPIGFLTNDG